MSNVGYLPYFSHNRPLTPLYGAFGIRQFRAFTAHEHKPCMKVLFVSSFVQMFATSFFLFYPMMNVLTFGYAIPAINVTIQY